MTRGRVLLFAGLAAATWLVAWLPRTFVLAGTGVDARGMPFGGDFIAFHAGARLALEGRASQAFDPQLFFAAQDASLAGNQAHFLWNYPPTFHLLVTPLGLFGLVSACLIWWGLTVPLYAGALVRVLPRWETALVGFASSAALLNLAHGQNGFLVTGLFVLGLWAVLDERPWLGGALLGCLVVKPHLALLVPVALGLGACWRALGAFCASAALGTMASILVFGTSYVAAFLENTRALPQLLASGAFPFGKLVSPYATARTVGLSDGLALGVQGACALLAVGLTAWAWRRPGPGAAAVLLASTPLISPYFYDYDLLLWSGAAVFAVTAGLQRGLRPGEGEVWFLAALVPIAAQPVWSGTGVQIGGVACLGLALALAAFHRQTELD